MTPDETHMARALELAGQGLYTTDPNPRVGCVVTNGGRVVGEGWHERAGAPHAEVLALRAAAEQARGATAFVTLEPCSHTGRTPPCAEALIAAGIGRVVCATVDPNPKVAGAGIRRLEAAGITVTVGTLAAQARALNAGFFSRFERGRPFIRLKLAMSLDARTAAAASARSAATTANTAALPAARPAWITDAASRADVQAWRARSSAVLTGAGTVRVDDPRLDVRLNYGPWVRQPLRVVLDPSLSCAPEAKIFRDDHAVIFTAPDTASGTFVAAVTRGLHGGAVRVERVPRSGQGLDLDAVVRRLAALEVNELLVECGPRLAAAFLEADLLDELILYVAPHFLGADAAPLAWLRGLAAAPLRSRFEFREQRLIHNDLRLLLAPIRN